MKTTEQTRTTIELNWILEFDEDRKSWNDWRTTTKIQGSINNSTTKLKKDWNNIQQEVARRKNARLDANIIRRKINREFVKIREGQTKLTTIVKVLLNKKRKANNTGWTRKKRKLKKCWCIGPNNKIKTQGRESSRNLNRKKRRNEWTKERFFSF